MQLDMVFHESAAVAEKRQSKTNALPQIPALGGELHHERRGNVVVIWMTGDPVFEPGNSDWDALDRCLVS
jgi:hypothetical protein